VMVEFFDQRRDFLQFYATEEPRLSEARNRIIDGSRERGFNFLASLIEEGIQQGVFTRADSRLATFAIQGAIRSLLLYYGPSRPVSEISRELGDFVLRALGADPARPTKPVHTQ
jgi:Tetracyclin repressor-like, C-terminal domain